MLMQNVQLNGDAGHETYMIMHTSTQKEDTSLARKFQEQLYKNSYENFVIDPDKYIKWSTQRKWNENYHHDQYRKM